MPTLDAAAFPTLDQARAYLRAPASGVDDGLIVELLNRVAGWFEAQTKRKLKSRAYAAALIDGDGTAVLLLPEFPVTAVASLRYAADRGFDSAADLIRFTGSESTYDYALDAASGEATLLNGDVWPDGVATVRASFTAGLTASDAPDMVQAQLEAAAALYAARGRDPALLQRSVAGMTESFDKELSQRVDRVVGAYRRASFE